MWMRYRPSEWARVRDRLAACFDVLGPDENGVVMWRQKRMYYDRLEQAERFSRASVAGITAAQKRWRDHLSK